MGMKLGYEALGSVDSVYRYHTPSFQPAERVVLGRAARNSAQAQQAAGVSPSASQIPTAVLVDPAGGEASARKVWTKLPPMGLGVPDPSLWP